MVVVTDERNLTVKDNRLDENLPFAIHKRKVATTNWTLLNTSLLYVIGSPHYQALEVLRESPFLEYIQYRNNETIYRISRVNESETPKSIPFQILENIASRKKDTEIARCLNIRINNLRKITSNLMRIFNCRDEIDLIYLSASYLLDKNIE